MMKNKVFFIIYFNLCSKVKHHGVNVLSSYQLYPTLPYLNTLSILILPWTCSDYPQFLTTHIANRVHVLNASCFHYCQLQKGVPRLLYKENRKPLLFKLFYLSNKLSLLLILGPNIIKHGILLQNRIFATRLHFWNLVTCITIRGMLMFTALLHPSLMCRLRHGLEKFLALWSRGHCLQRRQSFLAQLLFIQTSLLFSLPASSHSPRQQGMQNRPLIAITLFI